MMERLRTLLRTRKPIALLTDTNVARLLSEQLYEALPEIKSVPTLTIPSGKKDLETLTEIWHFLSESGMTREGILVNFGGGTVTDIGGFAAATFKRGIEYVNIPTTLLAMVDAAVGGKTGIDFNGLKNEVGAFRKPLMVIGEALWLRTLPAFEILSGFAEMLKTGLIADRNLYESLIRIEDPATASADLMNPLIRRTIAIKEDITEKDPDEQGLRKILNFGHTAGHAYESLARESGHPVPHGVAVGWGLLTELVLSHMELGLQSDVLYPLARLLREQYPTFPFRCKDYDRLMELMGRDKKNRSDGKVNFTLLQEPGIARYDNYPDPERIKGSLDVTMDLLGQ